MTELCKYDPSRRGDVISVINQVCDTEGHEVHIAYEGSNEFTFGYNISNGIQAREIFMIDDSTCREPVMIFASKEMQKSIREKVKSVEKSS